MIPQAAGLSPQLLPPEGPFLLNKGERKYPLVVNPGLDRFSGIQSASHVAFVET